MKCTEVICCSSPSPGPSSKQTFRHWTKRKGDCFESLAACYLKLHPNYATKLACVWHLTNNPPKVKKYLNLPGPDEGIDLVAQTTEGEGKERDAVERLTYLLFGGIVFECHVSHA